MTKVGTIRINTLSGANFSFRRCLDAFEKNETIRDNNAAMSTTHNVGTTVAPDRLPLIPCLEATRKWRR